MTRHRIYLVNNCVIQLLIETPGSANKTWTKEVVPLRMITAVSKKVFGFRAISNRLIHFILSRYKKNATAISTSTGDNPLMSEELSNGVSVMPNIKREASADVPVNSF